MCLLGRPATEKLFRSGFPTFRARRTLSLRACSVKSSISILWLAGIEEAQKRIDQAKKTSNATDELKSEMWSALDRVRFFRADQ